MSLKTTLESLKADLKKRIPEDVWNIMERRTEELKSSGIMDGVIKVGVPLPAFSLADPAGEIVNSNQLLLRGAVVLTVFRGHW